MSAADSYEIASSGRSKTRLTGFLNRAKGAILPSFSTLGYQTTIDAGDGHDVKIRHSGKITGQEENTIRDMVVSARRQIDGVISDIEKNWVNLSQESQDFLGTHFGYEPHELKETGLAGVQDRLKMVAQGLNSDKLEIKLKDRILENEFDKVKDGHGLLVKIFKKVYKTVLSRGQRRYPAHMYVDHGAHSNVFSESSRKTSIKLNKDAVAMHDIGALLRTVEKHSVGNNHFQIKREGASFGKDQGKGRTAGNGAIYGLRAGPSQFQAGGRSPNRQIATSGLGETAANADLSALAKEVAALLRDERSERSMERDTSSEQAGERGRAKITRGSKGGYDSEASYSGGDERRGASDGNDKHRDRKPRERDASVVSSL